MLTAQATSALRILQLPLISSDDNQFPPPPLPLHMLADVCLLMTVSQDDFDHTVSFCSREIFQYCKLDHVASLLKVWLPCMPLPKTTLCQAPVRPSLCLCHSPSRLFLCTMLSICPGLLCSSLPFLWLS